MLQHPASLSRRIASDGIGARPGTDPATDMLNMLLAEYCPELSLTAYQPQLPVHQPRTAAMVPQQQEQHQRPAAIEPGTVGGVTSTCSGGRGRGVNTQAIPVDQQQMSLGKSLPAAQTATMHSIGQAVQTTKSTAPPCTWQQQGYDTELSADQHSVLDLAHVPASTQPLSSSWAPGSAGCYNVSAKAAASNQRVQVPSAGDLYLLQCLVGDLNAYPNAAFASSNARTAHAADTRPVTAWLSHQLPMQLQSHQLASQLQQVRTQNQGLLPQQQPAQQHYQPHQHMQRLMQHELAGQCEQMTSPILNQRQQPLHQQQQQQLHPLLADSAAENLFDALDIYLMATMEEIGMNDQHESSQFSFTELLLSKDDAPAQELIAHSTARPIKTMLNSSSSGTAPAKEAPLAVTGVHSPTGSSADVLLLEPAVAPCQHQQQRQRRHLAFNLLSPSSSTLCMTTASAASGSTGWPMTPTLPSVGSSPPITLAVPVTAQQQQMVPEEQLKRSWSEPGNPLCKRPRIPSHLGASQY